MRAAGGSPRGVPGAPPAGSPKVIALTQFLRRNLLLVVATGIFLAVSALVLVQMDVVYYDKAKADVVKSLQDSDAFLNQPVIDNLRRQANQYLKAQADQQAAPLESRARTIEGLEASIRRDMQALLDAEPAIWRARISNKEGRDLLSLEEPSRLATQNDFSNNLFFRRWTRSIGSASRDSEKGVWLGTLEISYTTPRGVPQIEQLTAAWRLRAVLLVLSLLAFYVIVLLGVLLPIRSVIKALDKGSMVHSPIIARPRSLLERYFNNLARDANLSLLSGELRDFAREHPEADHGRLLAHLPPTCARLFPIVRLEAWLLRRGGDDGGWVVEERHQATPAAHGGDATAAVLACASALEAAAAPGGAEGAEVNLPGGQAGFLTAAWREDGRLDLLLVLPLPARAYSRQWRIGLGRSIAREARFALESLAEQRRLIMMEKRKANISLSRNLGHDLTNIIATSKLELMTVKALLAADPQSLRDNPERQQIFRESLAAVLDNTRFLQEIVNLYRSFTYMSRPRYEAMSLAEVARSVSELFQLSVSSSLKVTVDAEEGLEPLSVEPRLLRLALFNLLSNASDAIKRATTPENPGGEIRLRVLAGADGGQVIEVQDSGNGIRTPGGRLLEPEETAAIFELGYSTKEQGSGEGLGLNWVQQIVRDFHDGEIEARNRPGGGAVFTIRLPRRDHGDGDRPSTSTQEKEKP